MVNKEIARQFNLLANLMELHGENTFKTKAYANAYLILRKWDEPLDEMIEAEINAIPGIGASVIAKIHEYLAGGSIAALEKLKAITPEGVQQMLSIKGLGPRKVRQLWDELKVESPAELLYACNENRLVKLSGFGLKTQDDIRQKMTYYLESAHRLLYGSCEEELNAWLGQCKKIFPDYQIAWVGEMARLCPVINQLEILVAPFLTAEQLIRLDQVVVNEYTEEGPVNIIVAERFPVIVHRVSIEDFARQWCALTMSARLFEKISISASFKQGEDVDSILSENGFPGLPAECMDMPGIESASPERWNDLITKQDLKGIIHNHSTWSDGINSLEDMAIYVRDKGYPYFVICDHSRSAFYANGLSPDRVLEQMREIDALNKKLTPFRIFKGIESDILGDGGLDYEDDVLARFDLIVASVHSNLNMDESKAMSRLIRAIENPFTRILGHMTGRLLLARQGYPVDHRKVIDACAANDVVIELNANPLRLDIDYKWLSYCMDKNVLIAINPDAHSRSQVEYVQYGVMAARKGGLKRSFCLNAFSLTEFEEWIARKGR